MHSCVLHVYISMQQSLLYFYYNMIARSIFFMKVFMNKIASNLSFYFILMISNFHSDQMDSPARMFNVACLMFNVQLSERRWFLDLSKVKRCEIITEENLLTVCCLDSDIMRCAMPSLLNK